MLAYGEMLDRMAEALGRRPRPKLPVPFLTPRLSSLWIGLVTPVDAGVARPLIEGLSTRTTVSEPSGAALFDIMPLAFEEALRRAVADDAAAAKEVSKTVVRLTAHRGFESLPLRLPVAERHQSASAGDRKPLAISASDGTRTRGLRRRV